MKKSNLPPCVIPLLVATGLFGQSFSASFIGNTYTPSYSTGTPIIAPGQITTLYFLGAHANVPLPVRASTLPAPTTLAGFSVAIFDPRETIFDPQDPVQLVPILAVSQAGMFTAITVQINRASVQPFVGPTTPTQMVLVEGGKVVYSSLAIVHAVAVHIMTACDVELPPGFPRGGTGGAYCDPLITHADGAPAGFFTAPLGRAAKPGETLVMYALGLGPTKPAVPAGDPSPTPPAVALGSFSLLFAHHGYPPQVGTPTFVGLTPGSVGLYQVNFTLPPPTGEPVSRAGVTGSPGNLLITLVSNDWHSSDSTFLLVDLSNP